jgi:hypothetical protein
MQAVRRHGRERITQAKRHAMNLATLPSAVRGASSARRGAPRRRSVPRQRFVVGRHAGASEAFPVGAAAAEWLTEIYTDGRLGSGALNEDAVRPARAMPGAGGLPHAA